MPTLKQLARRHPSHREKSEYWELLQALMDGGSKLTPEIKQKILANPDRRPDGVIKERIKVARYFNKISPIANRFVSQLFAAPLQFEGSKDEFWEEIFFPGGALLPQTDDDGRATFDAFLKAAILQSLAQGKAIAQVDTAIATESVNKKQQRSAREDEPYVLLIPRSQLWDWETDRNGFKFAKLHRFSWMRDTWDSDPVAMHDFTIYQRRPDGSIVASRYVIKSKGKGEDFDKGIEPNLERLDEKSIEISSVNGLEERPIFNVRGQFKFPIVTLTLPPALWLADQLFDPQCSHYNQTASLEWGLVSTNYAMPTIESEDIEDFNSRNDKFGNGYFIHLDPSQKEAIGWTERPGASFSTSMEYRSTVEQDIDKTVQQIAISAQDAAGAASGETLRQAKKPEEILLTLYGSMVKDLAKGVLDVAAIAHDEAVNWAVEGMTDFDRTDLQGEATEYGTINQAGIPSETFTKELQKSFAREVAKQKEFDSATLKKILEEIDSAKPEPAEGEADPATEDSPPEQDAPDPDSDEAIAEDALNDPELLKSLNLD